MNIEQSIMVGILSFQNVCRVTSAYFFAFLHLGTQCKRFNESLVKIFCFLFVLTNENMCLDTYIALSSTN